MKQTQFKKDSDQLHINTTETYFNLLLNIPESNTAVYCKILQLLYKTIKEVDSSALIAKYKEEEEEVTESNKSRMAVKAKHALLNYTEAIPSFL